MKFFYLALTLLPAVMAYEYKPVPDFNYEPVDEYNYFIETDQKHIAKGMNKFQTWHRESGTPSPEKLEMERNGTLKGPKVLVPNPSFEMNMGKPWNIVGEGVEVVEDESLSRKGKNSLLFTLTNPDQRPEVWSVHLKEIETLKIYYLTFHYRIVEMEGVGPRDQCYIVMQLDDLGVGFPFFVDPHADPRIVVPNCYKKVTVPMCPSKGITPLVISVACQRGIGLGKAVKVSIDDIRIEKGEGTSADWNFNTPRANYRYFERDLQAPDHFREDTLKPEYAKTQIDSVKCEGDFCLVKGVRPEEDIKGSYDLNDAISGRHVADM
ncbi:uncharacterized protein B0J16DRAFT_388500 [Fusarium flagelliforme]|nr:uncharacterized protein B0J16DRAFT_388500 [Fusarium flagelliforme]KAH7174676.1 hypothetical protein B0J16DRAFT_388500 [Fusarium flagelliforme]